MKQGGNGNIAIKDRKPQAKIGVIAGPRGSRKEHRED